MTLHDLLTLRLQLAKEFTKPYHDRVKQEMKDYELPDPSPTDLAHLNLDNLADRRYFFPHHMILTYHDAMLASFFDRDPALVFRHRGKLDREKESILEAVYEYLKDVMDVNTVMWDAAWWYLLTGFTFAQPGYKKTGQQVDVDGQKVMAYDNDDPEITIPDPLKVYYDPESKPGKCGYFFVEKLMTVEAVKRTYNPKESVDADTTVKIDGQGVDEKNSAKSDLDRVTTYCYYGTLPESVKGEVRQWSPEQKYTIVFTVKMILSKDIHTLDSVRQGYDAQYYHAPTQFFGFGLARLLKHLQREKTMRRGQMARYADVAAFAKISIETGSDVDKAALRDPREETVLTYTGQPPAYLQPPNLAPIVFESSNLADQDAQTTIGLPSIATGSQTSSTVKTATGQSIFAEAAAQRARLAKRPFLQLYRNLMIAAFKYAQEHWDTQKELSIVDDEGNSYEIVVDRSMLADIDFDKDIDIDTETPSVNKDVVRAQAIELYNISKDDPLVNRKELLSRMLKIGFDEQNPDQYLKENEVPEGTVLTDPEGRQYVVDKSGSLVSQETQNELGEVSGDVSMPTEAADLGSVY